MGAIGRWVGVTMVVAALALPVPALASGPPVAHDAAPASVRSAHRAQTYRGAMAAIDATFARAVANATKTLHQRMAHAKSAADRIDARNRYRVAIVRATQERELEVEQLDQSPLGKNNPDQPSTTTTTITTDSNTNTGDH